MNLKMISANSMKCNDNEKKEAMKKKPKPNGKMLAIALKESASKGFKPFKKV